MARRQQGCGAWAGGGRSRGRPCGVRLFVRASSACPRTQTRTAPDRAVVRRESTRDGSESAFQTCSSVFSTLSTALFSLACASISFFGRGPIFPVSTLEPCDLGLQVANKRPIMLLNVAHLFLTAPSTQASFGYRSA